MRRDMQQLIAASIVATALSLAYVVVAGRLLQPLAYADFAAAIAVIYLIGTLASPVGPTAAHFAARFAAEGRSEIIAPLRQRARRRLAALCILAALIALPLSRTLAEALRFTSVASLRAAIVASLLMPFLLLDRGLLQGTLRFREYNLNTIIEAAMRFVVGGAILLLITLDATSAVLAYGIAIAAAILHAARFFDPADGAADRMAWTPILRHLGGMLALMGTYAVFQNIDMLAVKLWLPSEQAGFYGAAAAFARVFGILAWPLNALLVPHVTSSAALKRGVGGVLVRVGLAYVAMSLPVLLFARFAAVPLTRISYGEAFLPAASLLFPLMLAAAMTTFNLVVATALSALADFRFLFVYVAAAVVQVMLFRANHATPFDIIGSIWIVQGACAVILSTLLVAATRRTMTV